MILLRDKEILELNIIENGVNTKVSVNEQGARIASYGIEPFGYTFRLKDVFDADYIFYDISGRSYVMLYPSKHIIGVTVESVNMPKDVTVLGFTGKSSYVCRKGIILHTTQVEPGYKGTLTLGMTNLSDLPVEIYLNEGVMQANFIKVEEAPDTSYVGYYGEGRGIESAIHQK